MQDLRTLPGGSAFCDQLTVLGRVSIKKVQISEQILRIQYNMQPCFRISSVMVSRPRCRILGLLMAKV